VPGAGLGLTVVKTIVEGHGGTIAVLGAPGAGTTMLVSLPLA
jgi:two-component system, OmpR family, phosphate regulon sensor histidine kinase PhoR